MNVLLLAAAIFVLALFVIELVAWSIRMVRFPDRAEVRKRLKQSLIVDSEEESPDISKKKIYSDVPFLNQALSVFPGIERLDLLMRQANVKYTMGFLILLSAALGMTGYLFFLVLTKNLFFAVALGLAAASLPLFSLKAKKNKRMALFEKQLPDGLGLIARSLRAGHAFTSGMKLASEEFVDPLGPELEETLDEINFGVSVAEALKNMARRVDCPDLKFFVVAVILQRETGGNLAEIIESLAHLMRERFRFRGKVRTLSAEARLSAKILAAIPVLIFLAIMLLNPEYVGHLIHDPIGHALLGIGFFMMVMAGLVMRRILKLDV
jgi:tight adherence protein B